ncbi:transposase [Streptomyces sp. NPDC094438]|uniref:transposase n=1 Tax=Streptomyces sp. NPDC094438 TaxID=3366061 RepID=UPI0038280D11
MLHQPSGGHRCQHPPVRCRRTRGRGQPARLEGIRRVRRGPGCRKAPAIADGGYLGTGLLIPHRRPVGGEPTDEQEADNKVHRKARPRVEHVFSRMKNWKILRDCRLKGDGVHQAMLGIARLHNLALAG